MTVPLDAKGAVIGQFLKKPLVSPPLVRNSCIGSEERDQPVDAKTYPLQDILKPERRYIVPTFQRDYEWTKDGQWQLLFDDLASAADRLIEVRSTESDGSKLKAKEQNIVPHFLGAIVCGSLPFATGGIALRSIIDGQQRLTTIQLLIRGLLDALVENDSERAMSVRRMLFNPDDVVEEQHEIYKLWPRRRDREFWPIAVGDNIPVEEDFKSHLYLQARRFFYTAINAYATLDDGQVDGARLVALADALSSLVKLVVIDLDDNDDAQVIFEVLNGRQTPLSAIDLVKNLLFLRSELAEEDVERLYDTYWTQFDDDWWKEAVGRGHAQRGRRDVLLSVWLTAATGREANVGHLYRDAREYLSEGPSTEEVLRQLNAFAVAYRTIYGEGEAEDPRLAVAYERIRSLDMTTAVPLLAWLRTLPTTSLTLADHIRAVQAVESWALRRTYVGWQTRGYGTHLARVLRDAKLSMDQRTDIADAVIDGLRAGVLTWPSDEDVIEAFQNRKFYGEMSAFRLRLLLGALDQRLRSEDRNEPTASIQYASLEIEHVMPQSWEDHWPIVYDDGTPMMPDPQYPLWAHASAERHRAVNRLGNLTLVTSSFNREVSNRAWAVKRGEFEKQKSLVINFDVARSVDWNESSISERGRFLAAGVIRLWPSPQTLRSAPADDGTVET